MPDSPGWELITALVWSQSPLEEARAALTAILSHFGGALTKGSMPHVLEPGNPLSAAGSVPFFPLSRRTFTGTQPAAHSCCGPASSSYHVLRIPHERTCFRRRAACLATARHAAVLGCRAASGMRRPAAAAAATRKHCWRRRQHIWHGGDVRPPLPLEQRLPASEAPPTVRSLARAHACIISLCYHGMHQAAPPTCRTLPPWCR